MWLFSLTPFLIDIICETWFWKFFQNLSIAVVSVDCASPEVTGSKKANSITVTCCLTINRFCFAKRAWYKKSATSCQRIWFFWKSAATKIYGTFWISLPLLFAWQKVWVFFHTPFFLDFHRKRGFWKIVFSKLRPCVRACVLPEANSNRIGRFHLTKNDGF